MLVIPAAPPPVNLHALERVVIGYLKDHRFSLPDGLKVVTVPAFAKIAGGPFTGTTPIAEAMPGAIVVADTEVFYSLSEAAALLLHETLHETPTGGSFTYTELTPRTFLANEQATESTTQDLLRGLLRRLHVPPRDWELQPAYPTLVARERRASAIACRCPWTSRMARDWRGRHFLTPAAQRGLL